MGEQTHRTASTLVTGLGWTFVVLAGFAMLVCAMEFLLVALSFPAGTQALAQADHVGDFGRFVLLHLKPLLITMFVIFAVSLGAAFGLVKRAQWARSVFIGLMLLGVFWNIAGAVLTYYFTPAGSDPDDTPVQIAQAALLRHMALSFNFLVSVASVVLFGWIMQRLGSDDVRREFQLRED